MAHNPEITPIKDRKTIFKWSETSLKDVIGLERPLSS